MPAGCPNHPRVRAFVHEWIDAAIDTGADRIFCDEPHWAHPEHFGDSTRALGLPLRRTAASASATATCRPS